MKQPDDDARLRHMLDHGREAVAMLRGRRRGDLERDRQLNLAIVRLLEIVGEAAARVSAETRTELAEVPWTGIVGLRNRIVHGYDSVDFDIVWEVVRGDLPAMIRALEGHLRPGRGRSRPTREKPR